MHSSCRGKLRRSTVTAAPTLQSLRGRGASRQSLRRRPFSRFLKARISSSHEAAAEGRNQPADGTGRLQAVQFGHLAFLNHNAALNGLGPVAFRAVAWAGPNLDLGAFDLVIGSDVLYERGHAALLSSFLSRHASAASEVMLTDPGRAHRGHFRVAMAAQGYSSTISASAA